MGSRERDIIADVGGNCHVQKGKSKARNREMLAAPSDVQRGGKEREGRLREGE